LGPDHALRQADAAATGVKGRVGNRGLNRPVQTEHVPAYLAGADQGIADEILGIGVERRGLHGFRVLPRPKPVQLQDGEGTGLSIAGEGGCQLVQDNGLHSVCLPTRASSDSGPEKSNKNTFMRCARRITA
jgi:hypothetical protein